MKKVGIVILMATLYVIIYHAAPYIHIPDAVIIVMFILSPFVVAYMIYVILKHGKPSGYTFDERFYDDYDYRRISDQGS